MNLNTNKMKYKSILFIFSVLMIVFSSCYINVPVYQTSIQSLKKESKFTDENYEVENVCFNDSLVNICISIDQENKLFVLDLRNNTNKKIKIIWDEALIVKNNKQSSVIHEGTKFIDKNKTQLPSIVLSNMTLTEYFTLSNGVNFYNGRNQNSDRWVFDDIVSDISDSIIISIPIQVEETIYTYTSKLNIKQAGTIKQINKSAVAGITTAGTVAVIILMYMFVLGL